jgi:hypothetical protein
MKRAVPIAFTVAIAASLLATAQGSASAATTSPTATKFVMKSFGFATRASGGTVPVSSDRTAYNIIGCTTLAGLQRVNTEIGAHPMPVDSVRSAATTLWTVKNAGKVSSWARDSIAEVHLTGGLVLKGVSGTSHAYYDNGFKQHSTSTVASISYNGVAQTLPSPGNPLIIPGVATITVGDSSTSSADVHGAVSDIAAARVDLVASGTTVLLGKAHSTIAGGAVVGVFGGQAYASKATAAQPVANSGPTPLLVMACQGTHGVTFTRNVANLTLPHTAVIGAAMTAERGQQIGDKADMWTRAKVVDATLGASNELSVSGIQAQAHVWYERGTTSTAQRSSAGTTPGLILHNGTPVTIPSSGVRTIAGVARIETNIVTRTAHGLRVIALRVTLLDGSMAVINLGYASASLNLSQ